MKKFHVILLLLFGFLMTPSAVLACGKHSGKQSCKKEMSKTQDDNCCSNHKDSDGKHNGCDGKCGHKQCGCSSSTCTAGLAFTSAIDLPKKVTEIITGKQRFYHSITDLSPGFYSLWLIPKIS
jgi:hypothetical protein